MANIDPRSPEYRQTEVVTDPKSEEAVQIPHGNNDASQPGTNVLAEPSPAEVFGDAPTPVFTEPERPSPHDEPPLITENVAETESEQVAEAEAAAEAATAAAEQANADADAAEAAKAEAEVKAAEAAQAKEAAEAQVAELTAQVEQLQTDLEQATKPDESDKS
jgi:hypothetical protein